MNSVSKWPGRDRWNPDGHPAIPEPAQVGPNRINLTCNDGCGASLSIAVLGARDLEAIRSRVIAALVEIAAMDGWSQDVCPACRRWAKGTVPEARPVIADDGAHLLVVPREQHR